MREAWGWLSVSVVLWLGYTGLWDLLACLGAWYLCYIWFFAPEDWDDPAGMDGEL